MWRDVGYEVLRDAVSCRPRRYTHAFSDRDCAPLDVLYRSLYIPEQQGLAPLESLVRSAVLGIQLAASDYGCCLSGHGIRHRLSIGYQTDI